MPGSVLKEKQGQVIAFCPVPFAHIYNLSSIVISSFIELAYSAPQHAAVFLSEVNQRNISAYNPCYCSNNRRTAMLLTAAVFCIVSTPSHGQSRSGVPGRKQDPNV